MRGNEWPPSRAKAQPVAGFVEVRAELDELADAGRALVDHDAHGVDVAEAGAGGERVGEVQLG